MAKGSRYWARSFIVTTSGKKIYLSNTLDDLEEQMNSNKATVEVKTSNLYSETLKIMKKSIESYGNKL